MKNLWFLVEGTLAAFYCFFTQRRGWLASVERRQDAYDALCESQLYSLKYIGLYSCHHCGGTKFNKFRGYSFTYVCNDCGRAVPVQVQIVDERKCV